MTKTRTRILLTNDDGIDAPGLQALLRAIRSEFDVLVVAPMYEKSGAGCSLSLADELKVVPRGDAEKPWGYAVDGTPADCVKFAVTALNGYRPDFVLSGINRGVNMGNSVFYSGTVAATIEATLFGLPAMACSMGFLHQREPFFDEAATVVRALLPWILEHPPAPRTFWNLNMPNTRASDMGPVRYTTHGTSFFVDEFELYREEDDARYYKNVGEKLVNCAIHADADDRIITDGGVSLSLLRTDLTVGLEAPRKTEYEKEWDSLVRKS